MRGLVVGVIGTLLAMLWLIVLAATDFSAIAVSLGLLGMVCVTGRSR